MNGADLEPGISWGVLASGWDKRGLAGRVQMLPN
jgi:hypothetical protein